MLSAPRILLTTDTVGGVWRYSLELAAGLTACGAEILLVSMGPPPSIAQRGEAATICALRTTDLPLDWLAEAPAQIADAAHALAAIAAEWRADSVHLHTPALVPGTEWPVPVVAVAHSCVGTWWDAVRGGPLPTDLVWRAALVGAGLRDADMVLAPSHAFARALAARYNLHRRMSVVHNGRHALAVTPRFRSGALTTGRLWDEGKNVRVLDAAAARCAVATRAAGPAVGPNGAAVACENLHMLGDLDESALARAYADAAVFVSVALYEPFGLAALEAALAGCALVLSDIPTFRELWDGTAIFVDPSDPEAIASAITAAAHAPARLAEASRSRARAYSVEAMATATLDIHRALLAVAVP